MTSGGTKCDNIQGKFRHFKLDCSHYPLLAEGAVLDPVEPTRRRAVMLVAHHLLVMLLRPHVMYWAAGG